MTFTENLRQNAIISSEFIINTRLFFEKKYTITLPVSLFNELQEFYSLNEDLVDFLLSFFNLNELFVPNKKLYLNPKEDNMVLTFHTAKLSLNQEQKKAFTDELNYRMYR